MPNQKTKKLHCCHDSLYTQSKNGYSDRPVSQRMNLANGKVPVTMYIQCGKIEGY